MPVGRTLIMLALAIFMSTSLMVVRAESHTISFNNQCGMGTPQLVIGGKVLSNGSDWTSYGPAQSGIAYLQTGPCWLNGEHCAIIEFNLNNPACPGCGSSTDISLISPHALNVPTAFSYYNGCDGQGASCTTPGCNTAFHNSNDNQVQVACQVDNVNLLITFCPSGAQAASYAPPSPASRVPVVEAYAVPISASPSHTSSLAPYVSEPTPVVPPPAESGVVPNSSSPPPLASSPPPYVSKPSPIAPPPLESGVVSHSSSPPHKSSHAPYVSEHSPDVPPPAESKVVPDPSPPPPSFPSAPGASDVAPVPNPSILADAGTYPGKPSGSGKTCKRRLGHRHRAGANAAMHRRSHFHTD